MSALGKPGSYPTRWRTVRARFVMQLNPSKREVAGLPPETPVSFIPMEAVGEWGGLDTSGVRPLHDVVTGYTFFRDGDVLIAKITPCFENGKGAIAAGLVGGYGFGTTELHVLSPSPRLYSQFLFYVSISHPFRLRGQGEMYGAGGQKRVPDAFLLDFSLGLPEPEEQQAISGFLDRKTAAIDALIAKKERLIELLQEKRLALITQAVTKGLDPTVPMKDSGTEWIGLVPSHWQVARVKHVARLESGHTPSRSVSEHWLDSNDIPWISLNDTKYLARNDYISETALSINKLGLANSSAHMLPARIVVFTRDATIGKAAITTRPMAVSQHIIAWVCGPHLDPEYLLRVFYGMEQYLDRFTFGATIKTIGMGDVGKLVTPVPPLQEQRAIAAEVIRCVASVDRTLERVETQVVTLREYRQALITAAVTGQLDVSAETSEAA